MKQIKEICPNCKTAITYSGWEKVRVQIANILCVFGLLFIVYISLVGVQKPLNDMMNVRFEKLSRSVEPELRLLTVNITRDCGNSNSFCYANKLYQNISDILYVPSSLYDSDGMYDPLYVYKNKLGDCKNGANAYISMLRTVGVAGYVDCNMERSHCVAVVPYTINGVNRGFKAVVDLTIPAYVIMFDDEDVWDYYDIYANQTNIYLYHYWENWD